MALGKRNFRGSTFHGKREPIIVNAGVLGSTAVCEPEEARKAHQGIPMRIKGEKATSSQQALRIAKPFYPVVCQTVYRGGRVGPERTCLNETELMFELTRSRIDFRTDHLVIRAKYVLG